MYCKYCGKEIPVNSKFCRFCGKNSVNHSNSQSAENIYDDVSDNKATTQEELKIKRNKWIGWVLVVSSVLGFISIATTLSEGVSTTTDTLESAGNNPLPYIIDLYLGIQLIRQKEEKYLNWVFIRIILGLVIWGLLAAASAQWGTIFIQAIYSAYFIYLIKTPLTEKSLKIANYIILPIIVISFFIV